MTVDHIIAILDIVAEEIRLMLMRIGDSLATDVRDIKGVAAVSIWLNRSQRRKKLDIRRDYKMHNPIDLMDILAVEYESTSQTKNDQ